MDTDLMALCREYAELNEEQKRANAEVEKIKQKKLSLVEPIKRGFDALAVDPEVTGEDKVKVTIPTKYGARTISSRVKYSTAALVDRFDAAQALMDTGDPALAALVGVNYNAKQLNAYVAEQVRMAIAIDETWEPPAEWEGKIRVTEYTELGVTKA